MQTGPTTSRTTPVAHQGTSPAVSAEALEQSVRAEARLAAARQQVAAAERRLQLHERKYSPEARQAAEVFVGGDPLRGHYRRQDGLRQALVAAERAWAAERAGAGDHGETEGAVGGPTKAADGDEPVAPRRRPIPAFDPAHAAPMPPAHGETPADAAVLTALPHEADIAHLRYGQQRALLAAYLGLPHQAPTTGAGSSQLRLTLRADAPIFIGTAAGLRPPGEGHSDSDDAHSDRAVTLASIARGRTPQAPAPDLAERLLAMRADKALSPRDTRGINLAIAAEAARHRADAAARAAKSALVVLDVPQDIANVFGRLPADYFTLPRATDDWFEAVLKPSRHPTDWQALVKQADARHLLRPTAKVLRWEDPDRQKHVFVPFAEPAENRLGLVILQQSVAGEASEGGLSASTWRVLDPYRFRPRALRHFADTIFLGASRKLNRLHVNHEVRGLLGTLSTLVHEGTVREDGPWGRHFVLGHDASAPEATARSPLPPFVAERDRTGSMEVLPGSYDDPRGRSIAWQKQPAAKPDGLEPLQDRRVSRLRRQPSPSLSPQRSDDEPIFTMSPGGSPRRPRSPALAAAGRSVSFAPAEDAMRPRKGPPKEGTGEVATRGRALSRQPATPAPRKAAAPAQGVAPPRPRTSRAAAGAAAARPQQGGGRPARAGAPAAGASLAPAPRPARPTAPGALARPAGRPEGAGMPGRPRPTSAAMQREVPALAAAAPPPPSGVLRALAASRMEAARRR